MDVKINFMMITKSDVADRELEFLTKFISKPYGRETAMPLAWDERIVESNEIKN